MGECLIIRSGGGTDTSNATATADVILSGYTAYVNDELITGTMPVQSLNQTLSPGGSVTLPAGYYEEGENVISVSTLAEETAANAASSRILSGYSGWVNGVLVNGSMVNRGNVNKTLAANGSYTIPAGWHAGSGKVSQSLTKQGAKTVTPKTTNQTAVAANRWTTGNIVVAGNANLKAANIKNGITIFGIRGTFTGWVDNTIPISNLCRVYTTAGVGTTVSVYEKWDYVTLYRVSDMFYYQIGENGVGAGTADEAPGGVNNKYYDIIESMYNQGYRKVVAEFSYWMDEQYTASKYHTPILQYSMLSYGIYIDTDGYYCWYYDKSRSNQTIWASNWGDNYTGTTTISHTIRRSTTIASSVYGYMFYGGYALEIEMHANAGGDRDHWSWAKLNWINCYLSK